MSIERVAILGAALGFLIMALIGGLCGYYFLHNLGDALSVAITIGACGIVLGILFSIGIFALLDKNPNKPK
jgi:hypothetical protein